LQITSGLEPIAVELSGGQFLQPVQTLVATIICSQRGQMHIESNRGRQKKLLFERTRVFQLYSPSASYIALQ